MHRSESTPHINKGNPSKEFCIECLPHLQLPGKGRRAKGAGLRNGGSKETGPTAAPDAGKGSLGGADAFAEQDEMFNMGDMDGLMMEGDMMGAVISKDVFAKENKVFNKGGTDGLMMGGDIMRTGERQSCTGREETWYYLVGSSSAAPAEQLQQQAALTFSVAENMTCPRT
eukprot:1138199-Pelagomonas_calceolata.AAC.4